MNWPLPQDYNEAIQNPRSAFSDPDLLAGSVDVGPLGVPMPRSGGFADVYRIRGARGNDWAVKCFTRPVPGLQQRYAAISAHLTAAALPFAVGFTYLPEGIRVRGQWFPVIKMQWAEGLPLNELVLENLGRTSVLESLLGLWIRLCRRLRETGMAHADIQHGNVLLVPGAGKSSLGLKLVDYDGMFVPALAGQPPSEYGHPSYQHPERAAAGTYSADLDRFPHLVVATALRALLVGGKSLWDAYDTGDNMLFTEADFKAPAKSKLLRQLWDSGDPATMGLVANLAISATRPLDQTPWLDLIMADGRPPVLTPSQERQATDILGITKPIAAGGSGMMRAARVGTPVAAPTPAVPVPAIPARAIPVPVASSTAEGLAFADSASPRRRGGSKLPAFAAIAVVGLLCAGGGYAYWKRGELFADKGPDAVVPPPSTAPDTAPPPTNTGTPVVAKPSQPNPKLLWAVEPTTAAVATVPTVRFTPDGKSVLAAVSAEEPAAAVLAVESGRTVSAFRELPGPCVAAVPGPAGTVFALTGAESDLVRWDSTGAVATAGKLPVGHPGGKFTRIEPTRDGTAILLETPGSAAFLNSTDGTDLSPLADLRPGQAAAGAGRDKLLVFTARDKQLAVMSTTTKQELSRVTVTGQPATLEAWSPDGKLAVLLTHTIGTPPRQSLLVVEVSTGATVRTIDAGYLPNRTRFSADGSHLLVFAKTGALEVWKVADGSWVADLKLPGPPAAADLSPTGRFVAVAGPGKLVRTFDLAPQTTEVIATGPAPKGTLAELWTAPPDAAQEIKWTGISGDGKVVYAISASAAGEADRAVTVRGYDAVFGDLKYAVPVGKPGAGVPNATVALGQLVLAFIPPLGPTNLIVLDGQTGKPTRDLPPIDKRLSPVASTWDVSHDGKYFAATSTELSGSASVGIWDLETGAVATTLVLPGKAAPRFVRFRGGADVPGLLVALADGKLVGYPGPTFDPPKTLSTVLDPAPTAPLDLTADGERLLVTRPPVPPARTPTIACVDLKSGAMRTVSRDRPFAEATLLSGDRLALLDRTALTIVDALGGRPLSQTVLPPKATRVGVGPDGKLVAVAAAALSLQRNAVAGEMRAEGPKLEGPLETIWARTNADFGGTPLTNLAVADDGTVYGTIGPRIVTVEPAGRLSAFSPTDGPLASLSRATDGTLTVLEPRDGGLAVRGYDPKTAKPTGPGVGLPAAATPTAVELQIAADGKLGVAFAAGTASMLDLVGGRRVWERETEADAAVVSAATYGPRKVLLLVRHDAARTEFEVCDALSPRAERTIPLPMGTAGRIAAAHPRVGVVLLAPPRGADVPAYTAIETKTGKLAYTVPVPPASARAVLSPKTRLLFVPAGPKLLILNPQSGKELAVETFPGLIVDVAVSPDATHAAVAFTRDAGAAAAATRVDFVLLKLTDRDGKPLVVGSDEAEERAAIPPDASVDAATKLIRETFKAKYAIKTAVGRLELARRLLKDGSETKDDLPSQYALFKEAATVAADTGDLKLIGDVAEATAKVFSVDEFALRAATYDKLAAAVVAADKAKALVDVCEQQAEAAAEQMKFDASVALLRAAIKAAQRGAIAGAASSLDSRLKQYQKAQSKAAAVQEAQIVLKTKPEDPAANEAVGSFQCFALGKWSDGIPHLAKASSPVLKALAAKELEVAPGKDELALGDGWTDAAADAPDEDKPAYRQRARYWYARAATATTGLDKTRAESKLAFSRNGIDYRIGAIAETFTVNKNNVPTGKIKGAIVETIDFSGDQAGPDRGQVGMKWSGVLLAPRPGRYKIVVETTSQMVLKIDGKQILDAPADPPAAGPRGVTKEAFVVFPADRPLTFSLEWIGSTRPRSTVRLSWLPPGGVEELVPPDAFFHNKLDEKLVK